MATGRLVAETWLSQQLAPLGYGVFRHPAPAEARYPNITVGLLAAVDVRALGSPARVEHLTYIVRAWSQGASSTAVNTIAEAILVALDGVPPATVAGGTVNACRRIGAVAVDTFIEEGDRYQCDGGVYLIETVTTPT